MRGLLLQQRCGRVHGVAAPHAPTTHKPLLVRTHRRGVMRCQAEPEDEARSTTTPAAASRTPPGAEPGSSSSSGSSNGATTSSSSTGPIGGEAAEERADPLQITTTRLPKAVIEKLRYSVFGYDTLWVTAVDNYEESGVVFKGNLRSKDPAAAYMRMAQKLEAELGPEWQIFLLEDKDERPTAVVLPATAREAEVGKFTEVWLTAVFGLLTLATTLNSAGLPLLQFIADPFRTAMTAADVADAAPLAGAFLLTLAAHEAGHAAAAARAGVQLYYPLLVPAGFGFLGAFGAITRFRGYVPDRTALLSVSAAGPAAGAAASLAALLAGLALSAAGQTDVVVDSASFADSWAVALLAQAALGDALAQPEVRVNSLVVAGYAGLVVSALNCLPAGELDGGRVSLALFGRRGYTALGVLTTIALAISSFNSTLAFYWVIFLVALQRGPALPCRQEIAPPTSPTMRRLGYALLALPLLVLPPLPVELVLAFRDLANASLTAPSF